MNIKVIRIFLEGENMKLIVGLGNPGKEYECTRHNIGFMIIDQYIESNTWQKKFEGVYQITNVLGEKVLFLKPKTFMNLSGNSVLKAVQYYDIKIEDILIIQDDMDLEFGTLKLKKNSSSGGHNGIKSIISSLGTDSFCRLKVGISHDRSKNTVDYVLGKFSKNEIEFIRKNASTYKENIDTFIQNGAEKTMNIYN